MPHTILDIAHYKIRGKSTFLPIIQCPLCLGGRNELIVNMCHNPDVTSYESGESSVMLTIIFLHVNASMVGDP